jgi:hypothetical protein
MFVLDRDGRGVESKRTDLACHVGSSMSSLKAAPPPTSGDFIFAAADIWLTDGWLGLNRGGEDADGSWLGLVLTSFEAGLALISTSICSLESTNSSGFVSPFASNGTRT